ncbi:uncharacterized protein [Dysidea avara]|uniref:uncharacterized protein n=1 Tax=Dysidea avara TaxID=196820 RepID=UPI0033312B1E
MAGNTYYRTDSTPPDAHLHMAILPLYDHVKCPICHSSYRSAYMTTCGHRFCEECIRECVNRRHQCPICNTRITSSHLIKDHQTDTFIAFLQTERRKAEQLNFERVIEEATNNAFSGQNKLISAVEAVLHKHLRESLTVHEQYHQELKQQYAQAQHRINQEARAEEQKVIQDFPHDPDAPERLVRLKEIEDIATAKKESLKTKLQVTVQMLADAYDRYLTQQLPSQPTTLPVTVTLKVPSKNFVAAGIIVQPDENMVDLCSRLYRLMEERNFNIVSFPPPSEMAMEIYQPFDAGDIGNDECGIPVSVDTIPVLQHSMKPGSEIHFSGNIILESDLPKTCFAVMYKPGKDQVMDYYRCTECSINWVCQPCMEVCHEGHTLVPYISKHKPTWACCYCPKKAKCIIQNTT